MDIFSFLFSKIKNSWEIFPLQQKAEIDTLPLQ